MCNNLVSCMGCPRPLQRDRVSTIFVINFFLFFLSSGSHTFLIVGDRHQNFEDPMTTEIYRKKLYENPGCLCNPLYLSIKVHPLKVNSATFLCLNKCHNCLSPQYILPDVNNK